MSIQLRQNAETLIREARQPYRNGEGEDRVGNIDGDPWRMDAFFGFRFGRREEPGREKAHRVRAFETSAAT